MAVNIRTIQFKMKALGGLILPTGTPEAGKVWTATDGEGNGAWEPAAGGTKKFVQEKGWSFYNVVPAEATYGGFYVKVIGTNKKKIIGAEYSTTKGEVEFELLKNAEAITGFTGLIASSAVARKEPTAVEFSDKDFVKLKILKLTTTPENLVITLFIETVA